MPFFFIYSLSLSLRIQCKSVWKHTLAVKVAIHVWKHCGCVKLVRTRKWQVPYSSCTTGRNPAVCLYMTWNKVVKSLTYRFWNIGQSLWQPPPLCRTIALPLTTSRRSIFWFFDSKDLKGKEVSFYAAQVSDRPAWGACTTTGAATGPVEPQATQALHQPGWNLYLLVTILLSSSCPSLARCHNLTAR